MKSLLLAKPKFLFLSLKRNILPFMFCAFTLFLVLFSNSNLSATKSGLLLWANNVIPSLFPFFIATELLSYTNIVSKIEKFLSPIMRPVFNVPGCGAYALIMGIISGYPIGAKIVSDFKGKNLCTLEESERLIAFTNNSGPLFIIGTIGISLFSNSTIGILLFITHFLGCLTVGVLFRFWKKNIKSFSISKKHISNNKTSMYVSFSNLGEILTKSIINATNSILLIGGFVVIFSVILSMLKNSNLLYTISYLFKPLFKFFGIESENFISSFVAGLIELTNGLKQLSIIPCKQISINIILCSFLLGFGGISIFFQVFSITSKSNISIKPYILGKFLHGIFAAFYTYIFINYFPIFNFNL